MPKVRVHIEKDLIACVVHRERGLLLRKYFLCNVMALPTPVPGLPGQQHADRTDVLREERDIRSGKVVRLKRNIRNVPGLLDFRL